MKGDWQTVAALAVVTITVILLLAGRWRRSRRGVIGCECPKNPAAFPGKPEKPKPKSER